MTARKKKSIAVRLTIVIVALIFLQSILVVGTMIYGGVFRQTRENAYQTLYNILNNRVNYLQNEISNRWTNIELYMEQLQRQLPLLNQTQNSHHSNVEEFAYAVEPVLMNLLRSAKVTDSFVILNDNLGSSRDHSAIYFRDEDPMLDNADNSDVCLLAGPVEMTKRYASLENLWSYNLTLTKENQDFYIKPYEAAKTDRDPMLFGYFSKPFSIHPNDSSRITYTIPLMDEDGKLYGVMGIGISVSYLNQYLPSSELSQKDSLGYLIAYSEGEDGELLPIVGGGAYQKRMLKLEEAMELTIQDENSHMYLLQNHSSKNVIYACKEKINLYGTNTPFENEHWYLIGLQEKSKLMSLLIKIESILLYSLAASIALGTVCGIFVSYQFMHPIVVLSKKVKESSPFEVTDLGRFGLSEIDSLAEAIESGNRNIAEIGVKISQIIDLVDIPIGVFQLNRHSSEVMATPKLQEILLIEDTMKETLYHDKDQFIKVLYNRIGNAINNHNHVYKIRETPGKWVKINLVTMKDETLGVAIDVTEEYQEAERLMKERDYDVLTGLSGRRFFREFVENMMKQGDLGTAAMLMFDLDNFKKVNDTYGHSCGDAYLKTVAMHLKEMSSNGCIVGRRSGDEFFAFFYDFSSRNEIWRVLHQLYQTLEQNPFLFPDHTETVVRISAGIAWYHSESATYDQLLESADTALYQVKETGKNHIGE